MITKSFTFGVILWLDYNVLVLIWYYHMLLCPKEEKSNVSIPIRSIKLVVVFNVLCKRSQCVVELCPAGPIWSRDLTPSTQDTPPPPPVPGHWELSLLAAFKNDVAEIHYKTKLSTRMDLDSVVDKREEPNPKSVDTGQCMYMLLLYLLCLINHIME
jgi:hypothetical protein